MIRLTLLDKEGLQDAQRIVSALHYLKRPVDSRCSIEGYAIEILTDPEPSPVLGLQHYPNTIWYAGFCSPGEMEAQTVGYLLFGRPEATRCYPWYGDVDQKSAGKVECSRWEVLNLARVWLDPSTQPGGSLHRPEILPGFRDRRGAWRSSLASTAVREAARKIRLDYLLKRLPCFPSEPYQLAWLLSYCDTRLHKGTIYRAAGFELYRTNERGIQTWRLPIAPLSPAEDRHVLAASSLSQRSREYRDARAAEGMEQLTLGGIAF
jgi:hypothetical protein